jgi:hypothetical protein
MECTEWRIGSAQGRPHSLAVVAPRVVTAHLFELFGSEVVRDVKLCTDLVWGLAFDHVSDSLAG